MTIANERWQGAFRSRIAGEPGGPVRGVGPADRQRPDVSEFGFAVGSVLRFDPSLRVSGSACRTVTVSPVRRRPPAGSIGLRARDVPFGANMPNTDASVPAHVPLDELPAGGSSRPRPPSHWNRGRARGRSGAGLDEFGNLVDTELAIGGVYAAAATRGRNSSVESPDGRARTCRGFDRGRDHLP